MKTAELLEPLKLLLPATSDKQLISQMDHIIFMDGLAIAYDDKICISHPIPTEVPSCSVVAKDLINALKGIKEEDIELQLENDLLIITTESTCVELSTHVEAREVETLFNSLNLFEVEFKKIPPQFFEGASLCQFSISKDVNSDKMVYCLRINGDKIISTDGYRISEYTMPESMDNALIPYKALAELLKFDISHYNFTKTWAHFSTPNDITFSCRIAHDNGFYPNTDEIFNMVGEAEEIGIPKEFQEILEHVSPFCAGDSDVEKKVDINISEGKITCTAQKERGKMTRYIFVDTHSKVKFSANPVFLTQVLDLVSSIKISERMGVFESDNFRHVMVLP